ncbi:MAG: ATP-binding protein [Bacteroidota bacterium]|nr:ATP-binding protein [Bacteroidota bacterium]
MKLPMYPIRQSLLRRSFCKTFSLFVITFFYCISCFSQSNTAAKKGVLDLSKWDWKINGIANLDGEWEFYWDKLNDPSKEDKLSASPHYVEVPGFWNRYVPGAGIFKPAFGFATYRLKILCPQSDQDLDLKFLTVASNYKLFVNGKQLLEIGKVGTSRATATPEYLPAIVAVQPVSNELNIVIQVSNFNYSAGGLWDYIKLGTHQQVQSLLVRNIGVDFFIAGSFFLMGIFYLVIFFYFNKRPAALHFSLFCLLLSVRPLVTGELGITYISNWSWQLIKHVEFISFYLTVPVLSLFSYELFPKEFSKKILRIILIATAPFVLLAIFAPPYIFRYGLKPFQLIMILTAVFGLYVYGNAVRNKRPGSVYFLAGFIILFITIINDILYNSLLIRSTNLVYFGLFILIISQAIALSRQFFRAFSRLQILNNKLEMINGELNQKNIEINEANDQLSRLNSELDILVSRTSHDLRSPLTSVVALVHIIKNEKDEFKRHSYLDMQRRTLHRLNILITDILDFSRNKRAKLNFEPIDFTELLNNALHDHQFSENASHIERIFEVKQDEIFITDKSRLTMILYNLISNGLKYHDKAKDNSYLKVLINVNNEQAEIQVIDNGAGINNDDLANVFTMFYQANSNFKGSGLGLFIVHEAVEKLGGTIKIESALHKGTTFTVLIPNQEETFEQSSTVNGARS